MESWTLSLRKGKMAKEMRKCIELFNFVSDGRPVRPIAHISELEIYIVICIIG
jgi:hypothetical protein